MDEEMGIYRSEVIEIFEALSDVKAGVFRILRYIEDEDDGEEMTWANRRRPNGIELHPVLAFRCLS